MANYRIQTEMAGYWRGSPHRWSNVFHFNLAASRAPIDSTACDAFKTALVPLLFPIGSNGGGVSGISVYGPAGGMPIAAKTYFDWTTPAAWIAPTGTAWSTDTSKPATPIEVCWMAESPTGLSRTGKPITLKKFFRGVPAVSDTLGADIVTARQTALLTAFNTLTASLTSTYGLIYASPSGGIPGTSTVRPFYVNHQVPRGRKLKLITADGKEYRGRAIINSGSLEAD